MPSVIGSKPSRRSAVAGSGSLCFDRLFFCAVRRDRESATGASFFIDHTAAQIHLRAAPLPLLHAQQALHARSETDTFEAPKRNYNCGRSA